MSQKTRLTLACLVPIPGFEDPRMANERNECSHNKRDGFFLVETNEVNVNCLQKVIYKPNIT